MTEAQIPSMLTHTFSTHEKKMDTFFKPFLKEKNWLSNQTKLKLKFSALVSVNSPKNTNNWPRNVCGCSLPHSCVGRCHRIYTPLAKRFGSLQEQQSSAPPSLTLLPFMCSAEKGKTPSTVTHAEMLIYTHTSDSISNKCRWWWWVGECLIQYI